MHLTLRFVGGSPFTLDVPDGSTVSSILSLIHSHYPDASPTYTHLVHRSTLLPPSSSLSPPPSECLVVLPQRFLPQSPAPDLILDPGSPASTETIFAGGPVDRLDPAQAARLESQPAGFAELIDGLTPDLRAAVIADIEGFARALGLNVSRLDVNAVRAHIRSNRFHGIPVEPLSPESLRDLRAHPGKLVPLLAHVATQLPPDVAQQMRDDIPAFVRAMGLDPAGFDLAAARRAVADAIGVGALEREFRRLPADVVRDVLGAVQGDVARAREWLRQMLA